MHDVIPGFVAEEEPSDSLLDPRNDGWVLEKSWPGLFDLYTKNGEARAKLSPELGDIEAARLQNYSVEDRGVTRIKGALAMSAILCQAMREGKDGDAGFQHARKLIANRFTNEFGEIILEIFKATTRREAELDALNAVNLMRRSMAAIVHAKFPGVGRGNCGSIQKAVQAIWHARGLCEYLRRLPTKREVRTRLEAIGIDYKRSKDPEGKWAKLFVSAGLATLPE